MLNYRLGAFFALALTLFKVTGEWLFDLCVWASWCAHTRTKGPTHTRLLRNEKKSDRLKRFRKHGNIV
jgi:hypothetical protein